MTGSLPARAIPASFVEKFARATGIFDEGTEIANLAPPACLRMTSLHDEHGGVIAASCGRRAGHSGEHMDMHLDYQWTGQVP